MDATEILAAFIKNHSPTIGKLIDLEPGDTFYHFDLTASNTELTAGLVANTKQFSRWIEQKLKDCGSKFGIGGYMEHRTLYNRSALFDTGDEPRRLHLGMDIWAEAGTAVYAPLPGKIHSFQDNDHFGDYGPTLILEHDLNDVKFYSLYGHLSRQSLNGLAAGQVISIGKQIATLGNETENGNWPPHLHFQLMLNMEDLSGDYPGVCRFSEKDKYLQNIPNPNLILKFY